METAVAASAAAPGVAAAADMHGLPLQQLTGSSQNVLYSVLEETTAAPAA
jgi:hypothetical protein